MIKKTVLVYILLFLSLCLGYLKLPADTWEVFQDSYIKTSQNGALVALGAKGVSLGDSETQVLCAFGEAQDVLMSEYGFDWYIYHDDYKDYIQIGMKDGQVVAVYTNAKTAHVAGVTYGMSRDDARLSFGELVYVIDKPAASYRVMKEDAPASEGDVFFFQNAYIHVFYDIFKHDSVTSFHIIEQDMEMDFGLYGSSSEALGESFEKQNFYVTNALRRREGKEPFAYSEALSKVARSHAENMAKYDYFSHEDREGNLAHQRMSRAGIYYLSAGENLAMGSQNSLYMHEMLMNSEGHRKNILGNYQFLGVGVAFRADGAPFLAQNYTALY